MTTGVSVILPVHNQGDHIDAVVDDYCIALAGLPVAWEIILVENGSRDDSAARCAALAARFPEVRAAPTPHAGWGRAVRTGLAAARGTFLCYTNCARTRGHDLRRAVDAVLARPDRVVKAERELREAWYRRIGSWLYNIEARVLFGLSARDVNGTPKAFHRDFGALLRLHRDDDLIDLEFCVVCHVNGYPLMPLPIRDTERQSGKSSTTLRSAVRLYRGALSLRGSVRP